MPISFLDSAKPWENVRFRGEDVKCGAVLGEAGDELTAGRLGLLAAAGLAQVSVGRRPVAGLLASGSELLEAGQSLSPGKIYESNRTGLAALAIQAGAIPKIFPLVKDSATDTQAALSKALQECDLVITSGGVSVGEMDFIKSAFEQLGGELQFWKVAIRPGRPFVFGRAGGKLLFGLPGNPVSAFVTFLLLVRPALIRWQGARNVSLPVHAGTLAEPLVNPGDRRHFMRVLIDSTGQVHSAGPQASHILHSLAAANGLVDVPPKTTLPAGGVVKSDALGMIAAGVKTLPVSENYQTFATGPALAEGVGLGVKKIIGLTQRERRGVIINVARIKCVGTVGSVTPIDGLIGLRCGGEELNWLVGLLPGVCTCAPEPYGSAGIAARWGIQ